jgi:predicted transcriptional regulator
MSPRQKKPPVKPGKRQEWLERNENGESPPRIARADGFDARTVRKHIDIARQEKETKEARATVLRNALERHYADLCRYAERLIGSYPDRDNTEFGVNIRPPLAYENELEAALRQHIPRSPIWGLLIQQAKLQTSKTEFIRQLNNKIEKDVTSDAKLTETLSPEENQVIPSLVAALKSQVELWARGQPGLNVTNNLKAQPSEGGLVDLSYDRFGMGKVKQEHVELVREAINDWTALIKEWETFHDLERALRDLERVRKNLRDKVAVIALRRVVPGRCRYCPA